MKAISQQKEGVYCFESFHLNAVKRVLLRGSEAVPLTPKRLDILLALIHNRHRVVDKDELMRTVWPDTVVEESNLAHNISALRKALGERSGEHRFIVTIPGQGYRFVAEVSNPTGQADSELLYESMRLRLVGEATGTAETDSQALESRTFGLPSSAYGATDRTALAVEPCTIPALPAQANQRTRWAETRAPIATLSAVVALIAVGIFGYLLWPASGGTSIKSIAVLPFKPLVTDSRDEALEMGMSETLITRLSGIKEITVRPISAVRKYAGLEQDPVAAGREQQVDAVLDGNIQKTGERVRVTVRLVRVSDGQTLWADKFDASLADIFALEDSISERAIAAMAVKLTGAEKELLTHHYTQHPEAYQLYLKGRLFYRQWTVAAMQKAIECYDRAIAIDPQYALAYCGKADLYSAYASVFLPPSEAMPKAKEAARQALLIDDHLAEAHYSMAKIKKFGDWDWAGAESDFKRALEIKPNDIEMRTNYSALLTEQKRFEEAFAEMKWAQEIDPLSYAVNLRVGVLLYQTRRHEQAIAHCREAAALYSNFAESRAGFGRALRQIGRLEESIAELEKAVELERRDGLLSELGYTYALSGRRGEAITLVKELEERAKQRYVSPVSIARIYTGLGENHRVFEWLRKAYEDRSDHLLALGVDPTFDRLRSDPRFTDLIRRVGLPQ
jgi:DNA-binding winged helix-turn-helix (wHTH) protein/TolB-like protein/Flp pilus assembly protein TadD